MTLNPNLLNKNVQSDIVELQQQIASYKRGDIIEDKFKAYRLTRGVYGQRQLGVHMFRTKIPFGYLTPEQLTRLADTSEKFTNGNLHLTTRQNIQYHYVKLDDAPAIWNDLGEVGITAREACGNTVRNITASATAGIDPKEPFDVSPYVQETFEYFLRNPICQDMGRKIKIAFSSSNEDSAFAYFHDFGFIPRVREVAGQEERGFQVLLAGGLGAQPLVAQVAHEFLPEEQLIPFIEAGLRVFDRYGERNKRMKARMKFLIKEIGVDGFLALVEEETKALKNKRYEINRNAVPTPKPASFKECGPVEPIDEQAYAAWKLTNVFEQKQEGFYGINVRIPLGNLNAETTRQLASIAKNYASDDIRLTVNQGLLFKFVRPKALPIVYNELYKIGLAQPGFGTTRDITACPGTVTCNLAVANSTSLATALEEVVANEYPHLIDERNIQIKISGCMNSCGQHLAAHIGFHGSSIRHNDLVIPAMQVVIGGGVSPRGEGLIADKVIKVPSKRTPDVVRFLLNDYEENASEDEYFNDYYQRQGNRYFYALLKPLADKTNVTADEYKDWDSEEQFQPEVGVGECAGVSYDMVGAIIKDAENKLRLAQEALNESLPADSLYHSYSSQVIAAKALLLSKDIASNTQSKLISDFDEHFVATGDIQLGGGRFTDIVLQINKQEPSPAFAQSYLLDAQQLLRKVLDFRNTAIEDQLVLSNFYKA